jgi:hypothetical protein
MVAIAQYRFTLDWNVIILHYTEVSFRHRFRKDYVEISEFCPPFVGPDRLYGLVVRVRVQFPALADFLRGSGSEMGSLSLVSTTDELLGRSSGPGLESREYGRRDPSRWQRGTLHPQKLAQTSPTSGGRSVVIVRSRTKATEFFSSF